MKNKIFVNAMKHIKHWYFQLITWILHIWCEIGAYELASSYNELIETTNDAILLWSFFINNCIYF